MANDLIKYSIVTLVSPYGLDGWNGDSSSTNSPGAYTVADELNKKFLQLNSYAHFSKLIVPITLFS